MPDADYVPEDAEALAAFVAEKVGGPHDYNTSAAALWETALATFNYVAHQLGVTGFQAGYSAMVLLGKINGWDGPYGVVKGEELLYPQYDIPAKVQEFIDGWKPWAGEEARKLLAKSDPKYVHPDVWRRWEELATIPTPNDGSGAPT